MNIKKSTINLLALSLLVGSASTQAADGNNWLKKSLTFLSASASFIKTKMMTQKEIEDEARQAFESHIPVKDVQNIICEYVAPSEKPKIIAFTICNREIVRVASVQVLLDKTPNRFLTGNPVGFTPIGFTLYSPIEDQKPSISIVTPDKKLEHGKEYLRVKTIHNFMAAEPEAPVSTTQVFYDVNPSTFTKTDFETGKALRSRPSK